MLVSYACCKRRRWGIGDGRCSNSNAVPTNAIKSQCSLTLSVVLDAGDPQVSRCIGCSGLGEGYWPEFWLEAGLGWWWSVGFEVFTCQSEKGTERRGLSVLEDVVGWARVVEVEVEEVCSSEGRPATQPRPAVRRSLGPERESPEKPKGGDSDS